MQLEGIIGSFARQDGASSVFRLTRQGAQAVSDSHGRYHEAVSRNTVFSACNATGQAVTAVATSATTGFILYNPVGSGFNLSLVDPLVCLTTVTTGAVGYLQLSMAAAATLPTSTTALTVRSNLLGAGTVGVGVAYSAATLGTANVAVRPVHTFDLSAAASTGPQPIIADEIAGRLSLAPGFFVCLNSTTALSALSSMSWQEVPV